MASNSKKRTTIEAHNRANTVRERRLQKQAKKDAGKLAAAGPRNEVSHASAAAGR
jgi:hypothetical protein